MARLVVGTRGSKLALAQTQGVIDSLRLAHPDLEIEIRVLQTRGDATQAANIPLSSFSEKGIFAKELESALRQGEIDLAVHSLKDLAHTLPEGLEIAAIPQREDARDALIGSTLADLPAGARIGTGSVRRRALLLSRRPDLQCVEIRGNIDTRLRKFQQGDYEAICLAVAGLNRLGLQEQITEYLDPEWFTPDPGQGALALESRTGDRHIRHYLQAVHDPISFAQVQAERAFLRKIGGGCQTPLGALCTGNGAQRKVIGMVASPEGQTILRSETGGEMPPEELGDTLAHLLLAQGAERLLNVHHG